MQRLRRLITRRTAREAERAFVVEGATLLGVALAAGAAVESVYVDPRPAGHADPPEVARARDLGVRVHNLGPGVLERISATASPQPLVAIVAMGGCDVRALQGPGPILVCVDVRDPGNLGTVLRSAEAAGAAGVICCDGTVDVYNPKCVRASAGALFHVAIVSGGAPVTMLESLGAMGRRRLAAAVGIGDPYTTADLASPVAIVVGNEANGLPAGLDAWLDGGVHVPIEGRSESLNVGMACAVLCFEAARQRRALTGAGT